MPDPFEDFTKDVRNEVGDEIRGRLSDFLARQDEFARRQPPGSVFATGSFEVYELRGDFHLNIPARLADEETIRMIEGIVAEKEELHGVRLDVATRVKGGSNFVLEGRLVEFDASPRP